MSQQFDNLFPQDDPHASTGYLKTIAEEFKYSFGYFGEEKPNIRRQYVPEWINPDNKYSNQNY